MPFFPREFEARPSRGRTLLATNESSKCAMKPSPAVTIAAADAHFGYSQSTDFRRRDGWLDNFVADRHSSILH
jgi:hypothetical protein